MPPMIIVAALH